MIAQGWIEECEHLAADSRGISREAQQALGYRQIWAWLRAGKPIPLVELVTQIKTATRRFARKQRTWVRQFQAKELWLDPEQDPRTALSELEQELGWQ